MLGSFLVKALLSGASLLLPRRSENASFGQELPQQLLRETSRCIQRQLSALLLAMARILWTSDAR
jgi:hypothetical protein